MLHRRFSHLSQAATSHLSWAATVLGIRSIWSQFVIHFGGMVIIGTHFGLRWLPGFCVDRRLGTGKAGRSLLFAFLLRSVSWGSPRCGVVFVSVSRRAAPLCCTRPRCKCSPDNPQLLRCCVAGFTGSHVSHPPLPPPNAAGCLLRLEISWGGESCILISFTFSASSVRKRFVFIKPLPPPPILTVSTPSSEWDPNLSTLPG